MAVFPIMPVNSIHEETAFRYSGPEGEGCTLAGLVQTCSRARRPVHFPCAAAMIGSASHNRRQWRRNVIWRRFLPGADNGGDGGPVCSPLQPRIGPSSPER